MLMNVFSGYYFYQYSAYVIAIRILYETIININKRKIFTKYRIGLLTFAFYWLSGSEFPVFGKSMYFLLNNVSEALKLNIIH